MQPGGRAPAPEALALIQDFVNSRDPLSGRERWGDPEALRAWLVASGLAEDAPVSEAEWRRVRDIREALRGLLRGNNGHAVSGEAIATLNRAAERARLHLHFDAAGGVGCESGAVGTDGALGEVFAHIYAAVASGTWYRLKACRNEDCQWVFYDASKNRGGAWCSMTICGNRNKTRAYWHRHH